MISSGVLREHGGYGVTGLDMSGMMAAGGTGRSPSIVCATCSRTVLFYKIWKERVAGVK